MQTIGHLKARGAGTPLMLAVLVGAFQNIMSKSAKYSLFDPCKEMPGPPAARTESLGE